VLRDLPSFKIDAILIDTSGIVIRKSLTGFGPNYSIGTIRFFYYILSTPYS